MILIVVAVEEELCAVRRIFARTHKGLSATDCFQFNGSTFQLIKTGMGPIRAYRSVTEALQKHPVKRVISVGFAAGLDDERSIGDFIIIDKSQTRGAEDFPPITRKADLECILGLMPSFKPPYATCTILSVDHIVWQAREKHRIHRNTSASIMDMETASVAQAAEEAGIPWMGFRVITDTCKQSLPFDMQPYVTQEGELDRRGISLRVLTHPWTIPSLIRLGICASIASRRLTSRLEEALNAITS